MKDYELLEKQASMMRMAEKYVIDDWHNLVRYTDSTYGSINAHCGDLAQNIDYEFSLGVVEGKPVFEGDTLYYKDTDCERIECTVVGMSLGKVSVKTKKYGVCSELLEDLSWNPPKQKTVMVELPFDFVKANAELNMDALVLHEACRKALEEMK